MNAKINKKFENISEESIKLLVNNFYSKVRQNPDLKHIFEDKIGISNSDWQPHLENMYDFWSSILLFSKRYKRNPMKKHQDLPPFDESKFDTWLKLFAKTAHEIHPTKTANIIIEKSQHIATSLKYGLYYKAKL